MTCNNVHQRTRMVCSSLDGHSGWHEATNNGRTVTWNDAAGGTARTATVNVIIPDSFRAVKNQ